MKPRSALIRSTPVLPGLTPHLAARMRTACAGLGLAAFLCATCGGCFSGEYNRRMRATMEQLNQLGSIAAVIYGQASPVQDASRGSTGISMRLPLVIDADAKALAPDDADAQPPFLQLPGLAYAYELTVGDQPAFAYFAAVPVGQQDAAALAEELQQRVGRGFSGAAWRDVPVRTPTGGTVQLKLLSLIGPQKFGARTEDGRFDLYLVSSSTHHVLIGWRAPTAAGSAAHFFENAAFAMGSVEGNV